jgi:pimeloyl-ACP methyl ester carboxylesterase
MRCGARTERLTQITEAPSPHVLAPFHGERPPAPAWFNKAIAAPFETVPLTCNGAGLDLLCWGERGKPGFLLLHGNNAHARWWSPIAALLANEFRVAAVTLSGMGQSDWRPGYSVAGYAREAMAAANAAGLSDAAPPVIVGHSFGGNVALEAGLRYGEQLSRVILVDSLLDPRSGKPVLRQKSAHRIYPSRKDALARFRLAPPQPCGNLYYLDWIAGHALKHIGTDGQEGAGWTWRIDPALWDKLEWHDKWHAFQQARCPLAVLNGANSRIFLPEHLPELQVHAPPGTHFETILEAGHHVLLDQPLQLADAIRRIARMECD